MSAPSLPARWFDGRSSRPRPVRVALLRAPTGPALALTTQDGAPRTLRLRHQQIGWPERWSAGHAPPTVVVDLGALGSLEIDDAAGWQAALAAAGHRAPLAERMQNHWRVLLTVLLLTGAALWAFYRWGTPWAAAQLTRHVPLAWELSLSEQALRQLDEHYLQPSALAPARQAELRAGFERLTGAIDADLRRYPRYRPRLRLEFRAGMPANAFALPGGTIVMTDALVEQARAVPGTGEIALLGVLAHEIGHAEHRHTTRMVVEQGVLNIGLGLALGDVSSLVSSGASLVTGLAYRRGHEEESDCYALRLLRKLGLPSAPMGDLLAALEAGAGAPPRSPASAPEPPRSGPDSGWDWLSTHPATGQRVQRLRTGRLDGC